MAKKAVKAGGGRKRTVSGKRGKPGRKQQRSVDPRGVAGIVILCLGLLALASQFIPSNGGFLNQCMLIARGLGGTLCLLLPVVVCWAGVVLVFFAERRMSLRTLICGALIFLFVEAMFQLFQVGTISSAVYADGKTLSYGSFLARSYTSASLDCKGGGLIGALLAYPLYTALDIWGAMIVLIFALTIVLMVLTGVSFGGVGMIVSQWMDDLRVGLGERREERNALRAAREEAVLERENAQALERQKKRLEREAEVRFQKEQEEEPEDIPEEEPQEPPAPRTTRRKKKPDLRVVRPQEESSDWEDGEGAPQDGDARLENPFRVPGHLAAQERQRPRASAPRRRVEVPDSMPLYIERGDEFTRQSIDERRDARETRRRARFTIQEAEQAFLYGMNAQGQDGGVQRDAAYNPYMRPVEPVTQPEQQETPGAWEESDEADAITSASAPGADAQLGSWQGNAPVSGGSFGYSAAYQTVQETAPEYQDDEAVVTAQDVESFGSGTDESAYAYGSATEAENAYADGGAAEEEAYRDGAAGEAYPYGGADGDEADAAADAYNSGAAAVSLYGGSTAPVRAAGDAYGNGAPARAAGYGSGNGQMAAGASVHEAQDASGGAQTIVQLRGTRLDGTPLVVPKKDEHEGPQAMKEAYIFPPMDLLNRSRVTQDPNQRARDEEGAKKLLSTLESFSVQARLVHVTHGPAITRYEIQPAPGVKVSRIVNLVDDIALNMASDGVRIEAPIPGKPAVGIEIPNQKIETVSLRDVLESPEMAREKSPTAVALGKGISGAPVIADMAKMPHVLIAGATGSGKSVCINTIINSIIYRASPRDVRLILIDPKVVELSVYNGIPHLLVPVVTDPKKASAALSWAVVEMEHRYKRFETMGVRDIRGYNAAIGADEEPMSKIIVIIDELADLMMVAPGEVEESICRLAQLARAAGIHLVIATQRPSVNVITGVIKANIPSRIAFAVSSQIDSRTILDSSGAEKLLGKGDMLYAPQGAGKPTRVQGCFVSDDEVQRIVEFVRGNHGADYNEDVIEQMNTAAEEDKAAASDAPATGEPVDEMLNKAIDLAVEAGQVSISMLQRRLRVGYARAGRLVDEMTLRGITAEAEGPTKPRAVLISREEWRRMQENQE